jgi:hypothetical protein
VRIIDIKAVGRGAIFLALGLFVVAVGHRYPMGSAINMGPGYFPMLMSGLMIAFAIVNICLGLGRRNEAAPAPTFSFRPLALITLGMILFATLIERAGLIPAVVTLVILAVLAGGRPRWRELVIMLLVLGGIASALFVFGLGMPFTYLFGH